MNGAERPDPSGLHLPTARLAADGVRRSARHYSYAEYDGEPPSAKFWLPPAGWRADILRLLGVPEDAWIDTDWWKKAEFVWPEAAQARELAPEAEELVDKALRLLRVCDAVEAEGLVEREALASARTCAADGLRSGVMVLGNGPFYPSGPSGHEAYVQLRRVEEGYQALAEAILVAECERAEVSTAMQEFRLRREEERRTAAKRALLGEEG